MKRSTVILLLCATLVFALAYTTASKLFNIGHYRRSMHAQPFHYTVSEILVWVIPVLEMICITLLVFPTSRPTGFWLTTVLLCAFTAYTMGMKFSGLDKTTCPCGGLFSRLSWNEHLAINSFLTIISLYCAIHYNRSFSLFHGREKKGNADAPD